MVSNMDVSSSESKDDDDGSDDQSKRKISGLVFGDYCVPSD